jgi:hypothetical protein
MNSKEQKYFTEVALLERATGIIQMRPSMLPIASTFSPHQKQMLDSAHIYFICKKPRLSVNSNSLKLDGDYVHVEFELYTAEGIKKKTVRLPDASERLKGVQKLRIHEKHRYIIELIGEKDKNLGNLPIEFFFAQNLFSQEEVEYYQVLYIGQAYGEDGERAAIDRLNSHSTLQTILAEVLSNEPHNEIFLLCFLFDNPAFISKFDGIGNPGITDERDAKRWIAIHAESLSEAQRISIIEASLIRYFRPAYNIKFKDSFPSTNMKTLHTCYQYDLNAVIVEIDTECVAAITFSEAVEPQSTHVAKFDLHSPSERLSFFEMGETALKKVRAKRGS